MAQIEEKALPVVAEKVKEVEIQGKKRFVSASDTLQSVLEWDQAGDELIFEHEKGHFFTLSEADIGKLHHLNRVRYHVSAELHEKHDPENDEVQQRLKVVEMNDRRNEFEQTVKSTNQGSRATKKLQAFVGAGYEPFWARTDKIEERLEKGYEIVKPGPDIYAGVQATEAKEQSASHFETRVKPGETELVLMRIRKEKKAQLMQERADKNSRQEQAADQRGRSELRAMGATLVDDKAGANWQDRG
jgi:uncharacterized membrane protein